MTFLSLLLALFLERFTSLFEPWRSLAAFGCWVTWLKARTARFGEMDSLPGLLLALLPPLIVVAAVAELLDGWLLGLPALLFSVTVLIFAFGPDLEEQLNRYVEASVTGDEERIRRAAAPLVTGEPPAEARERLRAVVGGAFAEAEHRWFGVIFWFLLLGPVGAAAYRLLHELVVHPDWVGERFVAWAERGCALLDWAPARLVALSYGLAGSLEGVIAPIRERFRVPLEALFSANRELLAEAGIRAIQLEHWLETELDGRTIAMVTALVENLLLRTLAIWMAVLALLTISNLI